MFSPRLFKIGCQSTGIAGVYHHPDLFVVHNFIGGRCDYPSLFSLVYPKCYHFVYPFKEPTSI